MFNLINEKVKHKLLGVGTVIEQNEKFVTVEFATKTTKFIFPDSFDVFLVCENTSLQDEIVSIIKTTKKENITVTSVPKTDNQSSVLSSKAKTSGTDNVIDAICDNVKNTPAESFTLKLQLANLFKQIQDKQIIGVDLIELLEDEELINEIHRYAELNLLKALDSCSNITKDYEIIVISLTIIAMLKYDGSFYDNIRSIYEKVYSKYSEQKVEGYIRSTLDRYKHQKEIENKTRKINVVLENAIVPKNFLIGFFEFIFDIYRLNFNYDLPEDLYEEFRFIYEGLRSNLLSEGDNISINVTQKTYKLIATTKQLIKKDTGLDALIDFSIEVIQLIDKRFWDKEVRIDKPYFQAAYDSWEEKFSKTDDSVRTRTSKEYEIRSRWEPEFWLNNNDVYIIPPSHKVKKKYDYRDIEIIVLNDDEIIYRNSSCYIKEIIGGYQIIPSKIQIDNPLGKLSYRIVASNDIIYDSKDKLYRDFIVFNTDGQEIINNTDFEGVVNICYKNSDSELHNIAVKDNYNVAYKIVRYGDIISVGKKVFNFSSMIKPGIAGEMHENCYVTNEENEYLSVYKDIKFLNFEAENSFDHFIITINNKQNKLTDFQFQTAKNNATTKYYVDLDIDKSGIYNIEVFSLETGKKNKLLQKSFVYDPNLYYCYDRIGDTAFSYSVKSDLMLDINDGQVLIEDFHLDFISFEYSNNSYHYLLPFNWGLYQIDDSEWNSTNNDLWIDDISLESVMTLYDSNCDGLLVYSEKGALIEENIAIKSDALCKKISIGFLKSYKNNNRFVTLFFTNDNKCKYSIRCYYKDVIDENKTELLVIDEDKTVIISSVFYGKNPVRFEVINKTGENVFTSEYLESGQCDAFVDFNSFEEYKICFYEKQKGLILVKEPLYEIIKVFYSRQDFVNKIFKIDQIYYYQYKKNESIERTYRFNKAFLRITEMVDNDNFIGEIFVKTINGEWLLNNINPVEIEMCSQITDNTMDVYITNNGDGLLLDFEKHGILNALEHPSAPDIFLYNLSLKGE